MLACHWIALPVLGIPRWRNPPGFIAAMADWIEAAAAEIMGVGLSHESVDEALTLYYKVSMRTIKRTLAVIELLLAVYDRALPA